MNSPTETTTLSPSGRWSIYGAVEKLLISIMERAGLRRETVTIGERTIRYWRGGPTSPPAKPVPPLVLVHGFGGDALYGWVSQSGLAAHRELIIPDLLWFGGSSSTVQEYEVQTQAEMVISLIRHLGLPQVDMAGVSYGGFVTLEATQIDPERIRRVIIVDSPGHIYTLDDYHEMLRRFDLDSITDLIVPESPSGIKRLLELAFRLPPPMPRFVAKDAFKRLYGFRRGEKIRLLDDLLRRATEPPLELSLDIPSLVLWGDEDTLFPKELALRLTDQLGSKSRLHLIPRTRHAPNMERPRYFNKVVRHFLDAKHP